MPATKHIANVSCSQDETINITGVDAATGWWIGTIDFVKYGLVPMNHVKASPVSNQIMPSYHNSALQPILDQSRSRDRSLSLPCSESPKRPTSLKVTTTALAAANE